MEVLGMIDREFWKGRKVFVTGNTGFKGSWLSLLLWSMGASVCGYALEPPSRPSMHDVAKLSDVTDEVRGDIRDLDRLAASMSEYKPEVVFHLAAQALVRVSYQSPVDTFATNVMGTVNLLEAVRRAPSVRAVVVVTSDKCYENREWVWGYRENEPMGGFDPYSSSKGCAELVVGSYRRSFFVAPANGGAEWTPAAAIASARAGNVIGGGDWAEDRLVPDIMKALLKHTAVSIRNPHAVRPWQHVLEPLSGYLLLGQKLLTDGAAFAEPWNFGPSDEDAKPVEWIVKRICELFPGNRGYRIESGVQPHEASYLKLDSSKARQILGWRNKWALDEALRRTVEWTVAYDQGEDVQQVSLRQITAFLDATPLR